MTILFTKDFVSNDDVAHMENALRDPFILNFVRIMGTAHSRKAQRCKERVITHIKDHIEEMTDADTGGGIPSVAVPAEAQSDA